MAHPSPKQLEHSEANEVACLKRITFVLGWGTIADELSS
jgi:hypothetical protein